MRGSFEFELGRNHFLRSELRIGFDGKETVVNGLGFFIGCKPITPRRIFLGNTGLRDFKFFDFSGLQINTEAERSESHIRKSFRQCRTEFAFSGDSFSLSFGNLSALTDDEPNVLSDDFGRRNFILDGLFLGLFLRLRCFLSERNNKGSPYDRASDADCLRTL